MTIDVVPRTPRSGDAPPTSRPTCTRSLNGARRGSRSWWSLTRRCTGLQLKIPASYGALTATASGVRFEAHYGDMGEVARFLVTRNLPFVVHSPPALQAELLSMAEQLTCSATSAG